MSIEIRSPTFPESVADGAIAVWHAAPGDLLERDAPLVDIETDKVTIEISAPVRGRLSEIIEPEGATVVSDQLIARFEAVGPGAADTPSPGQAHAPVAAPAALAEPAPAAPASPAARRHAEDAGIDLRAVSGSGRDGRITKQDVIRAGSDNAPGGPTVASPTPSSPGPATLPPAAAAPAPAPAPAPADPASPAAANEGGVPDPIGERHERRVPMTRLRASIARRLVEAQQTAAMLTTFNEVDMSAVQALRRRYKDEFAARHPGARLGFMSFFVRAAVEALKRFPVVNASIDGTDVVYHGYYDIGVAVGTERGLVVPVLRDADGLSLAQIESAIAELGGRAHAGKLDLAEMTGGTFTISNGGTYGSLLSTPILNPPQTGILGMHRIQDRPVAVDGQVVIRPMMYLALSYDHRLIDGAQAVQFLIAIRNFIEDPARILLDL